jgi:UDP-N-acetylglucosamine 2-epimerase
MKIVTIIGARPQFIKASALSRAIKAANRSRRRGRLREVIVHTGQHYDDNMSKVFFEELDLPRPDYDLGIGSGSHGVQTGRMLEALRRAAEGAPRPCPAPRRYQFNARQGPLRQTPHTDRHVEAGLRSFNRKMPEEINRVLTDHVSSILFCPTETAVKNLEQEGFLHIYNKGKLIADQRPHLPGTPAVFNVGDVMFDTVSYNLGRAQSRSRILEQVGVQPGEYYLATLHRAGEHRRSETPGDIGPSLCWLQQGRLSCRFTQGRKTKSPA